LTIRSDNSENQTKNAHACASTKGEPDPRLIDLVRVLARQAATHDFMLLLDAENAARKTPIERGPQ
jgi:hypothetical protein